MDKVATARLVFYLDTLPEPRIVMGRDCTILGANRAYLEHYDLDKSTVLGRHCYEVSHRIDRPCYEKGESCPLYNSLQSGLPSAPQGGGQLP